MDISFGAFLNGNGPAGSTSTQKPAPEADDALREFRISGGQEEDVFTELMDLDQFDNIDKHIDKYLENDQNTLAQGYGAGTGSTGPSPKPTSLRQETQAEKKQLEIQTKMLCEQRARVQSENDRLQNEVRKLNEKCQTRDGEVRVFNCCRLQRMLFYSGFYITDCNSALRSAEKSQHSTGITQRETG